MQKDYIRKNIRKIITETILEKNDINEILKGYIQCALWTEEERLESEGAEVTFENVDEDSIIEAYLDIKKFIQNAGDTAAKEAVNANGLIKLGMDIWLTRNFHGAGFFDHSYENEEQLINAAKNLKSQDLYLGDDGYLHFM